MKRHWLAGFVLFAGCPNDPPPPPLDPVVIVFDVPEDGDAPDLLDVPYPIDLYREADGTLQIIDGLNRVTAGANQIGFAATIGRLNGFGLTTGVFFPLSGALDATTLTAANVGLLDITDAATVEIPTDVRFDPETELLSITPVRGTVLPEGHTFVAFVKGPLQDTDGRAIEADPALREALGDASTNAGLTAARALLSPAVDRLVTEGRLASESELLGVTVYTTQQITKDLARVQEMLQDTAIIPAPQAQFPNTALIFDTQAELDALLGDSRDGNGIEIIGRDQPGGVSHEHVGVVASGFYPSPQFQPDDANNNDDEQIAYDANGDPAIVNAARSLPFYLVLPDPVQSPMPVNGYPVVIWQHGLGGDRTAVWDSCDALAEQGFAIIAIDAINHGSRFPGAVDTKNNLDRNGFLGDDTLLDGIAEGTEDALFEFFELLLNLGAVRDNFRQSVIDLMALSRLVQEPSLDLSALSGDGSPFSGTTIRLDGSNISYYGTSFGGILGGMFVSLDPAVRGGVLNVPGGALLIDLFSNSPVIGGSLLPNLRALWALPNEFRFERDDLFMQMAQTILEGGDPIVYAPHLIREPFVFNGAEAPQKHLMVYEVIGDELVSNAGTEALAKAIGLSLATPFYPGGPFYPVGDSIGLDVCDTAQSECDGFVGGVSAALLQLSPATHGANMSSHSGGLGFEPGFPFAGDDPFPALSQGIVVSNKVEENVAAVNIFFQDLRDGLIPRIVHPIAPVADFDDDGASDEIDTAPTNPNVQ
jgi:hypothetical protein